MEIMESGVDANMVDVDVNVYEQRLIAEEVAMRMAEAVAILVTPHALVVSQEGGVVQCAARQILGESICEVAQIDESDSFDAEYEFVAEVVEECSTIGRLDVINFWERVIFAWVIGDVEQDMLSFSLHEVHADLFTLAPIVRLSPMTNGKACELALSVNGKRVGLKRGDFVKGALESQSIKTRALNIIFNKFVGAVERWRAIIDESELSADNKARFTQLIERRVKLLTLA